MIAATKRHAKWCQLFVKSGFKKTWVFVQNLNILYIFDQTIWFKFRQYVVQTRIK